jgi:membrane protein required for colicin V production
MNAADYLILGVLVISMLIGILRGFMREAVALIAWLCGLWLAWRYAPLVEPYLGGLLAREPLQTWTARAIILFGVLMTGWLVAGVLASLVHHSNLSVVLDRLLGMLFGVLRGAVAVAVFVILGQLVRLDQVDWWQRSKLLPYSVEFAGWIRNFAETGLKAANVDVATAGKLSVRA